MPDANLRYAHSVSWGEENHCNKVNVLATDVYFPNVHIYWNKLYLFHFNAVRFVLMSDTNESVVFWLIIFIL